MLKINAGEINGKSEKIKMLIKSFRNHIEYANIDVNEMQGDTLNFLDLLDELFNSYSDEATDAIEDIKKALDADNIKGNSTNI